MTSGKLRGMRPAARLVVGLLVAAIAAGGGYWAGRHGAADADRAAAGNAAPAAGTPGDAGKGKKLLFYRNPMGLSDTSPVPKKDPMGMDYIPVYVDDSDDDSAPGEASGSALKINTAKVQKLGVRTEAATRRVLERSVRAAGRVEPDERRLYAISPKFEGYVERLHVNVTGQPVGRGQPLFEVYSPELVSAQREYAIAAQGVATLGAAGGEAQSGMKQLADASLLRLRNWDISDEQIRALAQSGETKRTLTFRSPVAGIVTEKKALQGMRFMPGEALYQIADLSAVWVVADVFEQDIGLVRTGARASVRINAYPGKTFEGTVGYVYPTLNAATRTVPVRIELANPGLLLKPAMFAQVEVAVGAPAPAVTVPLSAVIDSGTRQLVFVAAGEGRFEPRPVKLGARSDSYVEVIDGVKEGEPVVVAANFLIDAESNLKAAIGGFGASGNTSGNASATTPGNNDVGKPATASVGHHARGTVDEIDAKGGALTISHGPVASLKWPAMTMEFKAANAALLTGLKSGAGIEFEFVERAPGEWVITALRRDTAGLAHAGH